MRQKSDAKQSYGKKTVKDISRATGKRYSAQGRPGGISRVKREGVGTTCLNQMPPVLKSINVYVSMTWGPGKWSLVASMPFAKTQFRFVFWFTRSKGRRMGAAGVYYQSQFIARTGFASLALH